MVNSSPLDILILGGTRFVGLHITQAALEQGHNVSLFHRGQSAAEPVTGVTHFLGDRDGGLEVLGGSRWDVVIDVSGYVPRLVRDSAMFLRELADLYVFISSMSVYRPPYKSGFNEEAPLTDPVLDQEDVTGDTYAGLKVACENVLQEVIPESHLIIRPGFIVGPYDYTDRFGYWLHRAASGGKMLAPDRPSMPMQILDGRDLAEWTIQLVEAGATGVYHAMGSDKHITVGDIINTTRRITGTDVKPVWVGRDFLEENQVALPLVLSAKVEDAFRVDQTKAFNSGLVIRPLEETVRDTLAWISQRPADHKWIAGLTPNREAELLEIWANKGN